MGPEKSTCRQTPEIPKRPGGSSEHLPGPLRNWLTLLLAALLVAGIGAAPSLADECASCISCHGNLGDCAGSPSHAASPGTGWVVLHDDTGHDDAGWRGDKPYFEVAVDCATCHAGNLPAIHGNDCSTCHPAPRNALGTWLGGCQQGGCHQVYHEDSIKAHWPWDDPYDPANNCDLCHEPVYGTVEQARCLNCHATYAGDSTPPETFTDAQASYVGPARIDFSIQDNGGKVGIGRTFYKLDGGPQTGGMNLFVSEPGPHALEFWSQDQAGNIEAAPKTASFTITADTTPPTTTSDAQASYWQGGKITLAATDDSTLGVKTTYSSLDGGPAKTGTVVHLPATSGIFDRTLTFWSADWAGNIEGPRTVAFTVTSGTGTLRLVWGDSDVNGSPCPGDPEAAAGWTIRKGGWTGPVVASGEGGCPGWSGVDDVPVPVSPTPYFVRVDWWDSYGGYDDQTDFPNVSVTTPGQVTRLSY